MSDASSPSYSRLAWRVARALVYLCLGLTVLFFALTRTEVGRDELRQQVQTTFNEQFAGELKIGTLQGTLLNDFTVTDVALRDENDRLVATIDSAYAQPRWYDLLTYDLSVKSLTIVGPHVRLHRDADTTWNIERVLRQRSGSANGFDLDVPNVVVRDGRITTSRSGEAPAWVQDRWLFDYTRSAVTNLAATVTLRWTDADRLVDVTSLSARLPGHDLTLRSAEGQFTSVDSRWSVQDVDVQLGNTRVKAEGTIQPAPSDSTRMVGDLQLAESQLDHDELRRLVPRLPVRETVDVEGRIGGSLDRLVVNHLTASRGRSSVTVKGTAYGLPDSLTVEAQVLDSQVVPSDLQAVWPDAPLSQMASVGPLRIGGNINGHIRWMDRVQPALDLTGSIRAEGPPGAVRGSLDVRRSGSRPLQYTASVEADSLNLAPVTGRPGLASRVTGRATVQGRGTTVSTLRSTIDVTLSNSQVASRSLSSASFQASITGRRGEGTLSLRQPAGGRLTAQGEIDATGPSTLVNVVTSTQDVNLASIHFPLPSTSLNATLTAQGRGTSWRSITGSATLDVDSSEVYRADSTVRLPPHEVSLRADAPAPDSSRIQLGGTIASATIEGSRAGPALWSSGRLWARSLRRAFDRQFTPHSAPATDSTSLDPIPPSLLARAESTLTKRPDAGPIRLRGEGVMHRMDILRKWWPGAPARAEGLRAETRITVSPDTLSLAGTVTTPHLEVRDRRFDAFDANIRFAGSLDPNLFEHINTEVSIQADTVRFTDRDIAAPSIRLSLSRGEGTLQAQAVGYGRTGPFRLNGDVTLRAGRTDVTLRELVVGAGQHTWISKTASTVSLHSNALVFDSLDVESQRPLADGTQQLQIHGVLSSAPSDTLYANASDVLVYPLAQLARLSRPIGGRLNGQVAVAGGLGRPQVRGSFRVNRLSFDRRILGTLQVQSRLTPDNPDLRIDAALTPSASSADSLSGPPLVPEGIRTLEENRLKIDGRVRLPGWSATNPAASSSDQLDLTVDVDRADLFFFKYIFDDNLAQARGYTAGSIHVGGRFRRPVFDAELNISNARFTLPQFGLAFSASGPVTVDREGIHTRGLSVEDEDGSALIKGSTYFNDYDYFSFDLSAELDELAIIDVSDAEDLPFYGDIRASGSVSLTGPLSDATLRSEQARTTPDSELFIPVSEGGVQRSSGYIIFADSTGQVPNLRDLTRRDNILSDRPAGEPSFLDGLDIDINVTAPEESTVNLVFDPVVGDVVTAVGSGRVQLQRQGGDFSVFGNFNVSDGTYLFTAGEVFVRRFNISGGTITWDGPPTNAQLDIDAEYRTRASTAGLPGYDQNQRIPVRVLLDIRGRVETPEVDLSLARVRNERNSFLGTEALDAVLNRPDRRTEYATSVLLTNTFLLTTESFTQGRSTNPDGSSSASLSTAGNQLAFNSVSQLVASQLNRYLGAALPNVDLNFGLQGEDPNDLDVIYGVALRLLNERLIIRGEGVYTGDDPDQAQAQGPQGEFVVELRLSNRVSVEAFYRRTGDELTRSRTLTSSTGAGLSYQTVFSTWWDLFDRVFGWLWPGTDDSDQDDDSTPPPVADGTREASSPSNSEEEDENPNN